MKNTKNIPATDEQGSGRVRRRGQAPVQPQGTPGRHRRRATDPETSPVSADTSGNTTGQRTRLAGKAEASQASNLSKAPKIAKNGMDLNGVAWDRGYGKPPTEHQFQKGKSGNPKGRPRNERKQSIADLIKEELLRPMTVTINGEQITESAQRLSVRRLIIKALQGDTGALKLQQQLAEKYLAEDPDQITLSPDDQALVSRLLENE